MIKRVLSVTVAGLLLTAPVYARQTGGDDPHAPRVTDTQLVRAASDDPHAPCTVKA